MSTTRIFATVEAFRLACPLCTRVSVIEPDGPKRRRKGTVYSRVRTQVQSSWDSRHQVLKCAWCGQVWQIGLVVRPKGRGHRERPADTAPTKQELARLRQCYGGGWWIDEPHTGEETINRYIPDECTCAPDPWRASCLVHGREGVIESVPSERRGE